MPLYLTSILGNGSEGNTFTVPALDQPGAGWIDLRPDPTVAAGRGILYLPVSVADARLLTLANGVDEILPRMVQTQLANAFSLTLRQTRVDRIVAELLLDHARTDGTRWRSLRPDRAGFYAIWLGGLGKVWENGSPQVWADPAVLAATMGYRPSRRDFLKGAGLLVGLAAGILATRRFAAAATFLETWPTDSSTLSSGQDQVWNEDSNDAQVSANKLSAVTTGAIVVGRSTSAVVSTDNHIVSADLELPTRDGSIRQVGVGCRKINSTTLTYYRMMLRRRTTGDVRSLHKMVAGSATLLVQDTVDPGAGPVPTSVLANGSTILGTASATFGPVTDTQITGNNLGAYDFNDATTPVNTLDNWQIKDLEGVGIGLFGPVPLRTILGVGQ